MPDTYQGTELWDFSLVDPDNRRPVDYDRRRRMLRDLRSAAESAGGDLRDLARDLVAAKEDGRIKLYVTNDRSHAGATTPGSSPPANTDPRSAAGPKADALRLRPNGRGYPVPGRRPAALEPRRPRPDPAAARADDLWEDTRLALDRADPALRWRNIFTGRVHQPEVRAGPLPGGGRPVSPTSRSPCSVNVSAV